LTLFLLSDAIDTGAAAVLDVGASIVLTDELLFPIMTKDELERGKSSCGAEVVVSLKLFPAMNWTT